MTTTVVTAKEACEAKERLEHIKTELRWGRMEYLAAKSQSHWALRVLNRFQEQLARKRGLRPRGHITFSGYMR